MTQFLEPVSTSSNTWTLAGDSSAHLCVDETIAGTDGDTTRLQATSAGAVCKLGLTTTGYAPSDLTLHKVKIIARTGGVVSSCTVLIEFMEGTSVIASTTADIQAGGGGTYTTYTLSLTSTEAGNISNYANLFVRLTASVGGAGNCRVTTVEFSMSGDRSLAMGTGAFTLTGNVTGLSASRKLAMGAGAFTLTGTTTRLLAGRRLPLSVGVFALTGGSTGLLASRRMTAALGSFALTGNSTGLFASRRMTAALGSFALTGGSTGLLSARKLPAGVGTFTLTGQAAPVVRGLRLVLGVGAFTLAGSATGASAARRLVGGSGAFTLAGSSVGLSTQSNVPPLQSVGRLDASYSMQADFSGEYSSLGDLGGSAS